MNSHLKIKKILPVLAISSCLTSTSVFAQLFVDINVDDSAFRIAMMDMDGDGFWEIADGLTQSTNDDATDISWNVETIGETTTRSIEFGAAGSNAIIDVNDITYSENPFITFSFDVTDTGSASTFGLSFSTPITLAPGATDVKSLVSGGLTDGGSDGVTLSEFSAGTPFLAADVDGSDLGVDLDLGGLPIIIPAGLPGPFSDVEGFKPGPVLVSTSTLSADIKFGLSGGDDIIAFTGRVDVDAVPEPSTYTLIAALGAASFVFIFRKRK